MKTQTFGIEIEMNRISRIAAAQVLADYFGTQVRYVGGTYDTRLVPDGQGRDWKIVLDNSIEGPQAERTEFVSPICRWEDIETVQELVRKLRAAGARAHTSCGVHVHIGRVELRGQFRQHFAAISFRDVRFRLEYQRGEKQHEERRSSVEDVPCR